MIKKVLNVYRSRFKLVLAGAVAALTLLAWYNRFAQDDAFISFRYARNLAEGAGLVWNQGQRIEGYTNFLWTVAIGGLLRLGVEAVTASYALGLLSFVVSLILVYRTTLLLLRSADLGLLVVVLVGTNYSFSRYATGGLETQMQCCLCLGATYLALRTSRDGPASPGVLALSSVLAAAALMTRLDSVLLLAAPGTITLWSLLSRPMRVGRKLVRAAALVGPALVLVGAWFAWKLHYYGGILPNTYYVKVPSRIALVRGGYFVYAFAFSYLLLPMIVVLAAAGGKLFRKSHRGLIAMLGSVVLWILYLLKVGGGFMEFRFMVPVWPAMMILLVWAVFAVAGESKVRSALVAVVFLGSIHHALTFGKHAFVRGIEPIGQLQAHLKSPSRNWEGIGRTLGKTLARTGAIIAVMPSGAIPYYSRLETVDMLGLNDRWVARHGEHYKDRPGHNRIATLEYLLRRRVNLVIDHPWMKGPDEPPGRYDIQDLARFRMPIDPEQLPPDSQIVEIPIAHGYRLVALYLVRSPRLDAVIRDNSWFCQTVSP